MLKMGVTFKEIIYNCFTKIGQFGKLNKKNYILDLGYGLLKNV